MKFYIFTDDNLLVFKFSSTEIKFLFADIAPQKFCFPINSTFIMFTITK